MMLPTFLSTQIRSFRQYHQCSIMVVAPLRPLLEKNRTKMRVFVGLSSCRVDRSSGGGVLPAKWCMIATLHRWHFINSCPEGSAACLGSKVGPPSLWGLSVGLFTNTSTKGPRIWPTGVPLCNGPIIFLIQDQVRYLLISAIYSLSKPCLYPTFYPFDCK